MKNNNNFIHLSTQPFYRFNVIVVFQSKRIHTRINAERLTHRHPCCSTVSEGPALRIVVQI